MGFHKGQAKLIGWLGEDPSAKSEEPRGFYVDHEYEIFDIDIRDMKTKALLSKVAAEDVSQLLEFVIKGRETGKPFHVTVYGDVMWENENGSTTQIASVHPGIWFPGHLPEGK